MQIDPDSLRPGDILTIKVRFDQFVPNAPNDPPLILVRIDDGTVDGIAACAIRAVKSVERPAALVEV